MTDGPSYSGRTSYYGLKCGRQDMTAKRCKNMILNGLTMLEMIISLAIIAVMFAVMLPQFKNIQNSWASKQATAEAIQNGRILIDRLSRHLAKAVRITAVSNPADSTGYIEFEGNDAITYRYDIAADNYVEFGPVGTLSDLAGPVSQLQFTCYDAQDLDTPITTVGDIRCVKVQVTLTNAGSGQDQNFTASAYLRTNSTGGLKIIQDGSSFEFDKNKGKEPDVVKIDLEHYLCVYEGPAGSGRAVVLQVDNSDWTISKRSSFVFDALGADSPSLAQIDDTHYLCAYTDSLTAGNAIVLTVNQLSWQVSIESSFAFDTDWAETPILEKIDLNHYLCVYEGLDSDGWAVVLNVDDSDWSISKNTPFEYDNSRGRMPSLSQIDSDHYLCAYQGPTKDGCAVILEVDTATWAIARGNPHMFNDVAETQDPALARIDNTHYLCAYMNTQGGQQGWAILLTADTSTLTVTSGNILASSNGGATPAAATIDSTNCVCAFAPTGTGFEGWSVILTVDTGTDTITEGPIFKYDANRAISPDFSRIDNDRYLCVYEGPSSDGWTAVLNVHGELRP